MVMPSSGPISMAQAHAEFGLGYSLSAYYGCDVGVPTSGAISLWHLYGKKAGFSFYRMNAISASSNVGAYEIEFIDIFGNKIGAAIMSVSSTSTGNAAYLTDGVSNNSSQHHFCAGTSGQWYKFSSNSKKRLSKVRVNIPANSLRAFNLYGANSSAAADNPASMVLLKSFPDRVTPSGWVEFVL